MKIYFNIKILYILLYVCLGCKSVSTEVETTERKIGSQNVENIKYADFDIFTLEGIDEIQGNKKLYPYVQVLHNDDSVLIEYYLKDGFSRVEHYEQRSGYYAKKEINNEFPGSQYIFYTFITKEYILKYTVMQEKEPADNPKRYIEYITKYTPSEVVTISLTGYVWFEPKHDLDIESIDKSKVFLKNTKNYVVDDQLLIVKSFSSGIHLANGRPYTETESKEYKLKDFPFNPNKFSFFWNIYLGLIESFQK